MSLAAADDDATSVATLSGWNQVFLCATILLFLSLSLISGRIIWRTYALQRRGYQRTRSSSGQGGGLGALGTKPNYSTPKHGSFGTLGAQAMGAANNANQATASTSLLEDEAGASASTGSEMRQRFFVLLFMASTIRVCSLVVEIATLSTVAKADASSIYCRLLAFFLWLPSLLFVSMYGLVLLFWAQLCYACWGKAYPWPRRIFFLFNVLMYSVVLALFLGVPTSGAFWRSCDLVIGGVYFVGLFGILYYSVRLIYFFRNQSPDDDFFFDLPASNAHHSSPFRSAPPSPRQVVLRRITAVCILLCVLFTVKAVYLIGMGTGYMATEQALFRSPVGVHHIAFEFAIHFTTEFVPCALMVFFTRKENSKLQRSRSSTSASMSGGGHHSTTNTSKPATPNFSLRGRSNLAGSNVLNHSGSNATNGSLFHDDQTNNLSGYQYQATQRAYGSTAASNARGQRANSGFDSGANSASNNNSTNNGNSGYV
ncbi:TPA: hypothetical protein N0F65_009611 [Lagenidium giganteum]|uniref:THH1/TOM1/TOM3 domain-containing protein n=1 Tax=Lagenidium giganteum TaxID=4803 RepID=A0AAV2YSQ5_9STRA|nr:TPA: hypothetical protein N0F65_009611 [Lagenidium giganteum]